MTQQLINIGDSVNDKRGDPLRTAFGKVNDNFTELYTLTGGASAALTELAQDYAAPLFTHADNVGISFSYNDITNKLIATVANQLPAQANNGGKYLTTNGTTASWATVSSVTTSATAPTSPALGDLWYDTESGRTYVYYDSTWVDSSPVDGNPDLGDWAFKNNSLYSLSGGYIDNSDTEHGATAALTIPTNGDDNPIVLSNAYGNVVLVSGASPGALKTWNFGTEGKLTLPAGTTYEYVNAPLTGHGDGLARLDFTLVTDGVNAQWAAASASPAGSGYSPGDTFTFDAEFLGIPGASVTIEVLTVGAGGSVENLGFSQPPLYPADIYRDSPINLQVGPESNRWTFGHTGKLTTPGDIQLGANSYLRFSDSSFQGTAFVGDATRLYGNLDQDVDVIARPTPATVTATTTAGTDPLIGQFEISLGLDAVQAGWEMNTGTEQSPIWTTVTNASLNPGEYWIYLASGFDFLFSLSTAYTFRNPALLPKTWTFDTNGLLTFPNGSLTMGHGQGDAITSTDALFINGEGGIGLTCAPTGPNLSQINLGDQGNINIRSLTASGEKYWYFNSDGTLTGPGGKLSLPPNGKITSGVGAQIGYQAVIATDLYGNTTTGEVGGSTVVNVGSNAQLLALIDPASEFGGSQYNLLSPITITYSDNTTQTFSSVRSTNIVTGSVIVFGSNSDTTAGHNFPITLETANYAPAYTAPEWTFGIDGALTFPDNLTVVNGIIGKASTATITEGEASQTTAIESQIEITTTGVVIAKRTSVTVNDGVTTTVNDNGSTLELDNTHASITYYIEPDGPDNNSLIQFTTDSSAGGGATIETVTEDVGGTAHGRVRAAGNSVQVSAKTFLGTNKTWSFTGAGDLQLPESGNILSNGANYIDLANFETSYNDAEGAYQDALTAWMTLETFRPVWFALPGRLAYDEMIAWTPTTGQPALPLNLPPVAKNAQDSYAAWQETIALSKLTVASDIAEFDFNSTGKLRLPQGGTVGGGDQAAIDTAYDEWQADEAGWQYLITTGGADLNVRPWNFAGPSRAEKQAVVLSMWQAQQSGDTIDWVPISSAFYNEARAWLAFTANQDGYENWKKLTTSINITSDDKTWTFTNDGALTLPDASVIASYKPVTVIAQTTTAQTITDSASAAFIQFVETVDTAGAFSPGTFTAPYTGYYQFNMSVYFSTTVSLTSTSFLLIDTNLDFTKQVRIIDGNWTGSYLHYSTVISATAGDAIRVAFRQVSGGDIDVSSGSRLTIHRVSIS